jgi:Flp pilus assembly protein TadD
MGRALERRQDLDGAVSFYQGAIRLRPNWLEAHCALGAVFASRGNFLDAKREFESALRIDPHHRCEAESEFLPSLRDHGPGVAP